MHIFNDNTFRFIMYFIFICRTFYAIWHDYFSRYIRDDLL